MVKDPALPQSSGDRASTALRWRKTGKTEAQWDSQKSSRSNSGPETLTQTKPVAFGNWGGPSVRTSGSCSGCSPDGPGVQPGWLEGLWFTMQHTPCHVWTCTGQQVDVVELAVGHCGASLDPQTVTAMGLKQRCWLTQCLTGGSQDPVPTQPCMVKLCCKCNSKCCVGPVYLACAGMWWPAHQAFSEVGGESLPRPGATGWPRRTHTSAMQPQVLTDGGFPFGLTSQIVLLLMAKI
jgi:hypothetical protein